MSLVLSCEEFMQSQPTDPKISPSAIKRIRLHLQCPWRNTHEARFHIAGILREFGISIVE